MTRYIALLRAVNLPGYQKVAMADLKALLARLAFAEPRSLLQSGNLLFEAAPKATSQLERTLETEVHKRFGFATDFFVRTADEWKQVVAGNPFPDEAKRDPAHLVLAVFKEAVKPAAVEALQAAIKGRERVRGAGRHAYFVYPDGIGRSRLTTALIESKLGTSGTGRNWNTVLKLDALANG